MPAMPNTSIDKMQQAEQQLSVKLDGHNVDTVLGDGNKHDLHNLRWNRWAENQELPSEQQYLIFCAPVVVLALMVFVLRVVWKSPKTAQIAASAVSVGTTAEQANGLKKKLLEEGTSV